MQSAVRDDIYFLMCFCCDLCLHMQSLRSLASSRLIRANARIRMIDESAHGAAFHLILDQIIGRQ